MNLFLRTSLGIASAATLSGCGSLGLKDTFANDAVCSVDHTQAYVNSMYGPVGIASKLKDSNTLSICGPVILAPAVSAALAASGVKP